MIPVLIFRWRDLKGCGNVIILDRQMTLAEFNHVASLFRYVPESVPFTAAYPCYQGEECLVYMETANLEKVNATSYLISHSTVQEMLDGAEIPF